MSTEHQWHYNECGKQKYSGKNLSQRHLIYHKSHKDCSSQGTHSISNYKHQITFAVQTDDRYSSRESYETLGKRHNSLIFQQMVHLHRRCCASRSSLSLFTWNSSQNTTRCQYLRDLPLGFKRFTSGMLMMQISSTNILITAQVISVVTVTEK